MSRLPAAERRAELIDTAVAMFGQRGYAGTTTSELAKAAGVTEPIIYRHFRSKKLLFIAVIERTGRETIEEWAEHLQSAKSPAIRLKRLVAANPMVSQRGRGVYRVIVQAMTEIEDDDIKKALKHHVETLHAFVAGEVRLAQELGHVSKAISPEVTAWMLLHLGLGHGILAPLGIDQHAHDREGTTVRNVIIRLMLGDRAKQIQDDWLKETPDAPTEPTPDAPADPNPQP